MKVGLVNTVSFKTNSFNSVPFGNENEAKTEVPVIKVIGNPTQELSKQDQYKARLKDPNWIKKYVPEGNFIHMKRENVIDGIEYEITPDGKVTEVGCWAKPTVIFEKDEDSKKMFERNGLNADKTQKEEPKKKATFKEKIANIWKFFSVTDKMVGSTMKGLIYGALTGGVLAGGAWVFRALPKAFTKGGPGFLELVKHPLKHIGKAGKIIAGVGAACVLAYNVVMGKLEANQKTAVIDHKMKTGHRDK